MKKTIESSTKRIQRFLINVQDKFKCVDCIINIYHLRLHIHVYNYKSSNFTLILIFSVQVISGPNIGSRALNNQAVTSNEERSTFLGL